jgi:hypothetical protein
MSDQCLVNGVDMCEALRAAVNDVGAKLLSTFADLAVRVAVAQNYSYVARFEAAFWPYGDERDNGVAVTASARRDGRKVHLQAAIVDHEGVDLLEFESLWIDNDDPDREAQSARWVSATAEAIRGAVELIRREVARLAEV